MSSVAALIAVSAISEALRVAIFGALAAQDTSEAEVIELTAHVENGQLVLEQPAPLRVKGSEINIYDKRIVIKLREPAAA